MKKAAVIAGPTASGKTEVSLLLAKRANACIISADSMQCYRFMDIGTAKPDQKQLNAVKHYMIDEYMPEEAVNVAEYSRRALSYIKTIERENLFLPLITGGSGLYIDSIVYDTYTYNMTATDEAYRSELQEIYREKGGVFLYDMLLRIDPAYAATTHPNNIKRVIRALEFYHTNNRRMSDIKKERRPRFDKLFYFALYVERDILYERINERVDKMIAAGLFDEAANLWHNDRLSATARAAIGYKEIIAYLNGETSMKDTVENIKQNSRNYAKRQYTWFRANKDIIWFDATDQSNMEKIAREMEELINA